jgi:hypothetical protein
MTPEARQRRRIRTPVLAITSMAWAVMLAVHAIPSGHGMAGMAGMAGMDGMDGMAGMAGMPGMDSAASRPSNATNPWDL